jgi:predicted DNA-binding transcriptional regulator YafY
VYRHYRETNRSVRLSRIQHALHKNSQGLTARELAGMCDTSVRNIQRDLLVLQSDLHIPIDKRSRDRYVISREYILPPVAFSLYPAFPPNYNEIPL